jgi:acetyl esterase/lipase
MMAFPSGFLLRHLIALVLTLFIIHRVQADTEVIPVWPGAVPGETGTPNDGTVKPPSNPNDTVTAITDVTRPTLTVFRPDKYKDAGTTIIVCPGGGYSILAWNLEGTEVAEWLNSIGVTAIVLKYRVPGKGDPTQGPVIERSLQDAQRSVSLVRSKAAEWGTNPNHVGILGFSAGGNVAAFTCTEFNHRHYQPIDNVDAVSCRPDFGVLIYPAWLIDAHNMLQLRPELVVTKDTPTMFIVQTSDDPLLPEGSVQMYLALHRAGVKAELHIFQAGGHGYGLRTEGTPISGWPQRCGEWLRQNGLSR